MGQKYSGKSLKKQFDSEFETYDKEVREVLPFYEKMHSEMIRAVSFPAGRHIRILDLGMGTGETSLRLLEKFQNAQVTGVDLSVKMMQTAKKRLAGCLEKIEFIESDMKDHKPKGKYEACTAVLSIHHLESNEKKKIFVKIHGCLNKGGIFVIGDIIAGNSNEETQRLEERWKTHLEKVLGRAEAGKWLKLYRKEDIPESVENQIKWLKDAGFRDVKCVWRKMNLAVISGKK